MKTFEELRQRLEKTTFIRSECIQIEPLGAETLDAFNGDGSGWDAGEGARLKCGDHEVLIIKNQWGLKPHQFSYVVFGTPLDICDWELQTKRGGPLALDEVFVHALTLFATIALQK
jgi:hypothetical protein